ncbi:hypothetical protein [Burkholderia ubonensis]|uniref:hypothetical protein n=1 Tax=Burkholderia ubonensis TaxID=101571 RepID=UPI0018DEF03A|nr:hypothetical protein [Burkholderia ubonensis]
MLGAQAKSPPSEWRAYEIRQILPSAAELVEKQHRAAGEHPKQGDTHCHCQIHGPLLEVS